MDQLKLIKYNNFNGQLLSKISKISKVKMPLISALRSCHILNSLKQSTKLVQRCSLMAQENGSYCAKLRCQQAMSFCRELRKHSICLVFSIFFRFSAFPASNHPPINKPRNGQLCLAYIELLWHFSSLVFTF